MSDQLQNQSSGQLSPLSTLKQTLVQNIKADPYTANITRKNPTAIVFLIDQSGSMSECIKGKDDLSKAEFCAQIINQTLLEIINVATKGEGVRNYMDIALIAYGGKSNSDSYFLIKDGFLLLTELLDKTLREEEIVVEQLIRGIKKTTSKKIPIWIEPVAESLTPMGDAFAKAYELLKQWIHAHPDSYPPTVINISDGAPTDKKDKEMLQLANQIKELHTQDGHIVLLNAHLDTQNHDSVFFPAKREDLPTHSKYANLMYEMSSTLPEHLNRQVAIFKNQDLTQGVQFVGMTYQTSAEQFIKMLDIGTKSQINNIALKS